ncbi:hypothetical protein CA13_66180 [Planctomycetes bacterium CA13]|uniref:PEP-CTERM protein-sorting domain-containing protein n=1 Tax=Novipirellula herctigrandis TaxID=2527986 RepID=A0A5C5ZDB8_9BACT|nr:hypothetical protein CA13_66180 [Planctomycetes bacterium CA13]
MALNGDPLRVFVEQDADFGTGLQFAVNGVDVGEEDAGLAVGLAEQVLFESHSDVLINSGFTNEFFGTIFTLFGGVTMNVSDMHGSIVSSRPIVGNVYLDTHASSLLSVSSVPEPSSILAILMGRLFPLLRRRKLIVR